LRYLAKNQISPKYRYIENTCILAKLQICYGYLRFLKTSIPCVYLLNHKVSILDLKEKSKEDCGDISDELRLQGQIRLFSEKNPTHIPA
jgi:hypothetical protein